MIWGLIILCGIAMASYVKLISSYTQSWDEVDAGNAEPGYVPQTMVTVIVAARNESLNIVSCIESLKAQTSTNGLTSFIIVDDHSEDDTYSKAKEATKDDQRFTVIQSENDEAGKKDAIAKAVAMSASELVVTTDADCKHDKDWILTLVSIYEMHRPDMILAPVVFNEKPGLLNRILRLEFVALMGSSGATAVHGRPTMCNGANLCYRKESFLEVNGFEGVDQNPSGDDVFLMLKMNERRPSSVIFTKADASIVKTNAPSSFKAFWQQRKRWLSKRSGYNHGYVKKVAYAVYFGNLAMLLSIWYGIQFGYIGSICDMAARYWLY